MVVTEPPETEPLKLPEVVTELEEPPEVVAEPEEPPEVVVTEPDVIVSLEVVEATFFCVTVDVETSGLETIFFVTVVVVVTCFCGIRVPV